MLFAIIIYDEPDSAALRDEHRQTHLDYLKKFDAQTLFAGPFTTEDESADLGSFRIVDFPDKAAAEKHIAGEPYVIAGIQKRWHVFPWKGSVPYTWRDCPRGEGNIQAFFFGLDKPGGMELRIKHRDAHEAYLGEHGDMVITRGPLLTDDLQSSVGSIWLLDLPDLETGRKLLDGDPFYRSGMYDKVEFNRWRFGRVFDRFKVGI